MRLPLLFLLLLLISSSAYGQGQTLRRQTLMHDGRTRRYELHVPSTYSDDQAWPLVLNLHGLTGSGAGQMSNSRMNAVSEREGFLVAYPSAISGDWSASPNHNVAFIDSLIDTISSAYNIDASRIYSTGHSQGGITSYILGAARPDTFAAIASVSGTRFSEIEKLRDDVKTFLSELPNVPARPLPLLHMHGTADPIVPFKGCNIGLFPQFGTITFPSVEGVLSEWLTNNNCENVPDITELDDARPNDRFTVTLHSYENCSRYTGESGDEHTAEIQFYRVNRYGHDWPASSVLDTSTEIWNFFSRHELPASDVVEATLLAGDSDQDLDFDQLDLVQVQIAAKYLTGQSATWGEGDWNGAPGGVPGTPPDGDRFFDQNDIVAALQAGVYLTGPYAALDFGGTMGDEQTSLVYDANTGELSVDSPASTELTSINIDSEGSKFIGTKPAALDGAFDNFATDNLFKATFGGSFGDISFGNVLPVGLSEVDVAADLMAVGSLAGGGDLGVVDLIYIPEPATCGLFTLGLVCFAATFRRHEF